MEEATFQEAISAYDNGHIIQSPYGSNYQRVLNKLDFIRLDSLKKTWKIMEDKDVLKKVKKYLFLYQGGGEMKLSPYFEKEEYCLTYLYDTYGLEEAHIICKINESEKIFEVIEGR